MNWVLYVVVLFWAIVGILFLVSPTQGKKFYQKLINVIPFWLWGVVGLIFAYLLWRSAAIVLQPWFVKLLAVIAGIKGISCLLIPKDKFHTLIDRFLQMSNVMYRVFGIIVLLLAYFLLSIM